MNKISVGDEFRHKFSYTQEDVDTYAKVSGDMNPLHIDEEAGRNSIFKRRIIHGYLGGSVFTKIFGTMLYNEGNIYMKQTLQFLAPMFVDHEYEAVVTVKEIFPEKNRVLYKTEVIDPKNNNQLTITGEALLLNKKQYVWE